MRSRNSSSLILLRAYPYTLKFCRGAAGGEGEREGGMAGARRRQQEKGGAGGEQSSRAAVQEG